MISPQPDSTSQSSSPGTAARRILRAAAELFARHGYHATTTRDIAAAVGVRQPAIYKHFSSKDAILAALVRSGLDYPSALAVHLQTVPAPAAVRLDCWISRSVRHLDSAPYVLASMLVTPELQRAEFDGERALFVPIERFVARSVAEGQREGDFRALEPVVAARLVLALFDAQVLPETAVPIEEIARFALAGLLLDPSRLPGIRQAAERLPDVHG